MGQRGDNYDSYDCFKSKGERDIARFLDRQDIAYNYEYPLAIVDRGKTKVWYPDFRLPEYNMIIEYFGMTGDRAYNEQMAYKMRAYKEAGVDGIYLLDSTMRGPWQEMLVYRIEQSLEGKLRKIQRHRENFYMTNRPEI